MNFQESVQECFRRYADFAGRASRPEFWWFLLFLLIANTALTAISPALAFVFTTASLVPTLAVATRRLHDTGRSGWWQLVAFAPLVGWAVLVFFLVQPGEAEDEDARIVA